LQFRKELDEGQQCKYIKIQILYKNYSKNFKFNKNFVILLIFIGKEIKTVKKKRPCAKQKRFKLFCIDLNFIRF